MCVLPIKQWSGVQMMMSWCLMSSDVSWHIRDKLLPMHKTARFNKSLRSRKPERSLERTAQDVHLDSHTAPELWSGVHWKKPKLVCRFPSTVDESDG